MTETQQRVTKVLERMLRMTEQDDDYAEMFSDVLETGLDDLHCNDAFGTEGQCDPRGDGRNGEWTMDNVEGVDD